MGRDPFIGALSSYQEAMVRVSRVVRLVALMCLGLRQQFIKDCRMVII